MKTSWTKRSFWDQLAIMRTAHFGHTYRTIMERHKVGNTTISFILSRENLLDMINELRFLMEAREKEFQAQKEWNRFLGTLCLVLVVLSTVGFYL